MSDAGKEPVDLGEVTLGTATEKAVRVLYPRGRELWVPMRCIHDDSEIYGRDVDGKKQALGDRGKLIVLRWWAEKNGLSAPSAAHARHSDATWRRR